MKNFWEDCLDIIAAMSDEADHLQRTARLTSSPQKISAFCAVFSRYLAEDMASLSRVRRRVDLLEEKIARLEADSDAVDTNQGS